MAETIAYPFASNLLSKLGECLFVPIGRQFGYVLCYKSNVEDLENAVNELKTAQERVEHSVNEAVHNGKPIHEDVKNWLKSVKEETEKADYLLNRNKSAKDACFRGWLPNPVVRYPIGGKVKKMTQVIQGHHDKSKNSIFEKVFYENTPIGIVTTATSVARSAHRKEDVLESRASITEDVIKAITDDKVCVIGVYGPGGVGKSKLMEDIERRVKEEQLFDVVATTNVSRNPDLKRIQGEIAYALGLKLVNEETAFGRADLLCKKLEEYSKKKILIILDNLWAKLELKDVGIPCGYDNKVRGCKLLLTSRYRGDLYTEMGSDQEFQLSLLGHGEARMLFERTVGDRVNDPQFESFVDRVVRNCGGLPLLIVSLAKRLKRGDLPEWRNALTNMGGSSVKSMVELNYNDLEDERIKFLFLVRALRSGRDSVRDTLVTCMGLGLYKKFSETIENARDRLIMDLRCLLSCSLLLGSDNVEKLSMHDLFVDVAISMHDKFIDTEWNALVGRKDFGFEEWSKYDLRKCTAMVFDNVGIDELPKKLDCPNMRILLLSEHNWSLKFPESFFESMEKLQVLDLTGFAFTSLPSSMGFLENLKSLCLDQCHLEDVTALGKLKGLQFLGFFDSTIARLPKEMGELIKLRFLDLTGCTMLKVIEPGVLESLVNLEELYMQNSFDQWEAEDKTPRSNASLAEFKNMKRLSTLHIAIPRSATLSRDLPFGKLNKYEILIGDVWDWSYEYKESRTLKLKLDSGNLLHEEWVQRCLQRTQVLHLMGLQDNHSIHDLCFKGFRELKHLHVQNSPSLHYVVHSTKDIRCTAFMRLESLFLENLNNLEKICCGRLALESFSKLKIVKLDNCGEIKCLFPSSMMRIFLQLEDIKISRCRLIKQIVADAEADEDGDEIDVDPKVKSCNLHRLTLQNLPEMTSFCKIMDHSVVLFNIQQVEFPNMESIEISHMNKVEKIWFDGLASNAFSKLKTLVVEHCEKLSSIFSSYTMLTRFQTLEEITVTGCGSLEVVFHIQEFNFSEARCTSTFQLRELILMWLSKLKHVWSGHPQGGLNFGCLRHMEIVQCERLKSLFPSLVAESMTQLEQLSVNSCGVEEIIAEEDRGAGSSEGGGRFFPRLTQLTLIKLPELRSFYKNNHTSTWPLLLALFSVEKVGFPAIESMEISQIPNVEKIWVDELASDAFSKLKTLRVDLCEKLASIFSSDIILTRLRKLEELTVTNCGSLEVVFQIEEINMSRAHNTSSFRLRQLNLERLPKIKHMWSGHPNGTLKFESLQCLKATECESLQSLFPNSVAKCMTQLEQLLVSSCGVEEIIAEEDGADVSANDLFFPQLTDLRLLGLPNLRSFYRNSHTSTWPILKQLRVRHCGKMRSFSFAGLIESCHGSTTSDQRTLFSFEKVITNLKGLTLTREDIMMMMQQHYIFGNLEELELACYHDENVVFPSDFLLHRFPHLEVLSLSCSSFEEIFPEDVFGHGGATPHGELTDVETPLKALGNLKLLELNKLCKLQRVWKDGSLMAEILKHIRFLLISECSSLSIVLPSLTAFQRLTKLEVKGCTGLVHMGTCSAMQSLVHLTRLILRDCGKMEDVVTYDGNEIEEVSFPKLEELILDGLPSLESFSSTNCAFRFPLLWQITVKLCANMNIFCNGALNTPILHKVCLFDKDYKGRWEGDLNTTIQSLST